MQLFDEFSTVRNLGVAVSALNLVSVSGMESPAISILRTSSVESEVVIIIGGGGNFPEFCCREFLAGEFEIAIIGGGGSGFATAAATAAVVCTAGTFDDFLDLKPLACRV